MSTNSAKRGAAGVLHQRRTYFSRRLLILVISFLALATACTNEKNKPDVSGIDVDIKIQRFEQQFFQSDTNNIAQSVQQLQAAYPQFASFFIRELLGLSNNISGDTAQAIFKYILSGYRPVNDAIQKKYSNLNWLEEELEEGFRYVKHYYPSYKVPGILTFVGTFDAPGVVYTPGHLAIGLQQFAGKDFPAYQDPQVLEMFPTYISKRFDKEYISANVMKAVVDDIYPDTTDYTRLIEVMIEKGKQWWLLDKFLPDAHDSVKTGYTSKQLEWCEENEGNIWTSVLKSTPDIFTVDPERLQNYIGESPKTMDLPDESPGNIGQWIGWRIVAQYESKNKDITVQELLATPALKIFQESKYRPK